MARYPKISQFTLYTIDLGCAVLVIGLFIGFYDEPWFLVSAISLFLGSTFIMVEYDRGTISYSNGR
ncbi:hypothetical protein A3Q34_18835 [Colwellia sp. PAMC 20917]|nr:hypothetical protein A3Q34_18835 [Colwellia sp. PAMC 20917]